MVLSVSKRDGGFGDISGEAIEVARPDAAWWVRARLRRQLAEARRRGRTCSRRSCASVDLLAGWSRQERPRGPARAFQTTAGSQSRARAQHARLTKARRLRRTSLAEEEGVMAVRVPRARLAGPRRARALRALQSLLAYLLTASAGSAMRPVLDPGRSARRRPCSLLNLVNFGGGLLHHASAELRGDEVRVDEELFGGTLSTGRAADAARGTCDAALRSSSVGPMIAAGAHSPLRPGAPRRAFAVARPRTSPAPHIGAEEGPPSTRMTRAKSTRIGSSCD